MKSAQTIIGLCFVLVFVACHHKTDNHQQTSQTLKYAQGFTILQHDHYKEVVVMNPWVSEEVLNRYYLVKNDTTTVPSNGYRIKIPIKTIGITSSTHVPFLQMLKEESSVIGICSPKLIYNSDIREQFDAQQITDMGDALDINAEQVITLRPDILMAIAYNNSDSHIEQLKRVGISVVYNIEWMETSLLARAEWIKFVAAFYDKEAMADSIFQDIEERYIHLKLLASTAEKKPSILSGGNFRGTWYVPAGNSYMGKLFLDAGATYLYADNKETGSLPLTVETVLANFSNADVWVGSSATSRKELKDMDEKHALFKAYKQNRVYNFNKRTTPDGANDFWETGVARPDLILADLIKILHPELLPEHELFFSCHIE